MKNNEILTQMKAIRAKCLDCMGYSQKEVDLCPSTNCTLYPYRYGKTPIGFKKVTSVGPFLRRIESGVEGVEIKKIGSKVVPVGGFQEKLEHSKENAMNL